MNTIKVEFNQQDLNDLQALLDAAVKALGLQAAKPSIKLVEKLEAAVAVTNQSTKIFETNEGHD